MLYCTSPAVLYFLLQSEMNYTARSSKFTATLRKVCYVAGLEFVVCAADCSGVCAAACTPQPSLLLRVATFNLMLVGAAAWHVLCCAIIVRAQKEKHVLVALSALWTAELQGGILLHI